MASLGHVLHSQCLSFKNLFDQQSPAYYSIILIFYILHQNNNNNDNKKGPVTEMTQFKQCLLFLLFEWITVSYKVSRCFERTDLYQI